MAAPTVSKPASKSNKPKSKATLLNALGYKSLLTFTILTLACIAGFASRLFAVIRFESIIHEFDPWYYVFFRVALAKKIIYLIFDFSGLTTEQLHIWCNMDSIIS